MWPTPGKHSEDATLWRRLQTQRSQNVSLSTGISDSSASFDLCWACLRCINKCHNQFVQQITMIPSTGFCCQDGVPERGCVWCRQIGDSQSTGSSSDFRWCSPRCNLRRFPECANNPECRRKRPKAEATKLHTFFTGTDREKARPQLPQLPQGSPIQDRFLENRLRSWEGLLQWKISSKVTIAEKA